MPGSSGSEEHPISHCSLKWAPPPATRSGQQKIFVLSRRPFCYRNFALKKVDLYFVQRCTWQVNGYYLNNKVKAYGLKLWLISLRSESLVVWNQQSGRVRRWMRKCQFYPNSSARRVYATVVPMSSNLACLSRDNHTPRGLEALSWTLCLATHLGCHYLMITILSVKPYCLIRGYEGDKTKRNRMNRT